MVLAVRRHDACAAAKSRKLFTSVQKVCGYTIPSITACRHVNGMRHAFAIHDGCGSGNPVLRRGGDYAVRLLGRYVDNNNTPTIPVKPSLCKPYGLFDLLKRLDLVEGTVMYDNTLYHVLVERRYVAMA